MSRDTTQRSEMPLSELVVLGLLAEKPRHGYEIEQQVTSRRFRDWTPLGRSLVYNVLTRVRRRRWVSIRSKRGIRGPSAEQCRLAARGKDALRSAIEAAIARGIRDPARTEVALMFSWVVGQERAMEALHARLALIESELARTRYARQAAAQWKGAHAGNGDSPPADPYVTIRDAVFDHVEAMMETEARWCRRMVQAPPMRLGGSSGEALRGGASAPSGSNVRATAP